MSNNPNKLSISKRTDLSSFLIHLSRNGTRLIWNSSLSGAGKKFKYAVSPDYKASDALKNILSQRLLLSNPQGYYRYQYQNHGIDVDELKSVCFSETPLNHLKFFYEQARTSMLFNSNRYEKYGLAFDCQYLAKKYSANPVFYVNGDCLKLKNDLEKLKTPQTFSPLNHFYHLVEFFGQAPHRPDKVVDFRWEREWRIKGDFKFELAEVQFGISPTDEIPMFEALTHKQIIFIDPDWDVATIRSHFTKNGREDLALKL